MGVRTCEAEGCQQGVEARGLCNAHYLRERRKRLGPCEAEGCDKLQHSRGLCTWHYRKQKARTAPPCKAAECGRGVAYPSSGLCTGHYARQWWASQGNESRADFSSAIGGGPKTYNGAHHALRRDLGPASDHECIDCGTKADHWSYSHESESEIICPVDGHPYSLDWDDYSPRCVTCHNQFDRAVTA